MGFIKWFDELSKDCVSIAGGKGANLGEMYKIGIPVPPGFVVTTEAYEKFVEHNGIKEKIFEILSKTDINNPKNLMEASNQIQELFINGEIPEDLKNEIIENYRRLSQMFNEDATFVAVRSSATAEDTETASFAGQQATFLNVKGDDNLLDAVKKCWASLWTARAINYRTRMGFDHETVSLAVVIQKQVHSKKSGVMFSCNPVTNNCSEIVIEASWGLGEAIVSGQVTPDEYIVDKSTMQIKNVIINEKRVQTVYNEETGETVTVEVPEELRKERVLSDEEILTLASLAIKLERHYGKPQDIEFAIDDTGIYIVQTRAITTVGKEVSHERKKVKGKVLLEGIPASPGIGVGKVRLVLSPEDFDKFQEGEVLVAKMTNPDFEPLMAKASAIVTDEGGANCHAAIVSRELGKPCVVGTGKATEILQNGMIITVDGSHGVVYEGAVDVEDERRETTGEVKYSFKPITATRIMLIATHPEVVKKYRHLVDGIGLLRLEFLIAQGGKHPIWYLNNNKLEEYTEFLVNKLQEILHLMDPKPVIVRTLDMRTDEYRNLEGGDRDPKEANPMLGWHGIRRSLDQPELFEAELQAYDQLIKDYGFRNIWIMFPFVVSWREVKQAIKYVKKVGITPNKDAKIGIMVETPAAALTIEDIIKKTKIRFLSFGTNDLTQLTLGVDRNNEIVQKVHSEKHPAVLKQIKRVIRIAKKYNVYTSICGQAGSDPEYAEKLVKYGIDSISVNPDAIELIRETVFRTERKIILEGLRKKVL